ncbi:MAG TPA: hypothetical protein VFZ32_18150 [Micromonosporaceae bacterium]
MTQPPGHYGQPGGSYGDPYGQSPDPYGQPSGPPAGGYGGAPAGYGTPGYPPAGMPPPAFPQPPVPRKSRTGLIIGIVAGVLVLLLCGGGALFYLVGGGSTTATVEGFLESALKDRDLEAAKQYVCAKEVDAMKRDFTYPGQTEISVSWSNVRETSNDGANAEVAVAMTVKAAVNGQSTEVKRTWVFKLVNESGWKVCDIDTGDGNGG